MAGLLALMICLCARAQDRVIVSSERPAQESAVALIERIRVAIPSDGMIIYLHCREADCAGQSPDWFTTTAWEEGLGEAGPYDPNPALGLGPERLAQLRQNWSTPPDLAIRLAEELTLGGLDIGGLLLVYPTQRGNQLELNYHLHYTQPSRRDLLGRLTVRLPPAPPPMPPPKPPYWSHASVRIGAGTMLAGVAIVTTGVVFATQTETPSTPVLSVTTMLGWGAIMGGGAMMIVPAVQADAAGLSLHLRR